MHILETKKLEWLLVNYGTLGLRNSKIQKKSTLKIFTLQFHSKNKSLKNYQYTTCNQILKDFVILQFKIYIRMMVLAMVYLTIQTQSKIPYLQLLFKHCNQNIPLYCIL